MYKLRLLYIVRHRWVFPCRGICNLSMLGSGRIIVRLVLPVYFRVSLSLLMEIVSRNFPSTIRSSFTVLQLHIAIRQIIHTYFILIFVFNFSS